MLDLKQVRLCIEKYIWTFFATVLLFFLSWAVKSSVVLGLCILKQVICKASERVLLFKKHLIIYFKKVNNLMQKSLLP